MEKKETGKVRRRSIRWTLLALSIIPIIVVAVVMGVVAVKVIRQGMQTRALEGLKFTCVAVEAGYNAIDDGLYSLNEEGHLVKGGFDLSADETVIDNWTRDEVLDVTVFYGDTRMSTSLRDSETGERLVGTKASDEVIETVLKQGKEYQSVDIKINNKNYYGYYKPVMNGQDTPVGMVFAGMPSEEVDYYISQRVILLTIIAVALAALFTIICLLFSVKLSKVIKRAQEIVGKLAVGDLTGEISPDILRRPDELGEMGRAVHTLGDKLRTIIGDIQDSAANVLSSGDDLEQLASQTSQNADGISSAVEDISKGAVAQAEDIEVATSDVANMGNLIERIVSNIDDLNTTSITMQQAESESSQIMAELRKSNDLTVEAIEKVSENVHATDASVNRIAEAVEMISSISSQTNLLSLNASIEAARAGEAGKGFAVVASEIQKLADESNSSAQSISEIIATLSEDSRNSLKVMEEVKQRLDEQESKLMESVKKFGNVSRGISSSREGTDTINTQAKQCDEARVHIVDIISNLSAVSEENAASTQETTASMQELNATISLLAESAVNLKELAAALEEGTKFFKL